MRSPFTKGVLHGIPIGLGYLSVSFGIGIKAVSLGLPVWGPTRLRVAISLALLFVRARFRLI